MQKQKKPFSLMAFIRPHRAGFITSTVLAVLSVASGMVPYFAVARMVNLLISGEKNFSIYLTWGGVALIAYLLKSILHGISTRCSHEATFHVLSELRRAVADKLTHVSMGYLTDTPSGRLKTTMVERVEQMEVPLAHIIPEMTANLLIPLAIVVYLFVLDWRMALVSLLTIPVGILCYMAEMKEYPKKYGAVVQAGKHMSATTVEYINGIEVIKAFNQSAASYTFVKNPNYWGEEPDVDRFTVKVIPESKVAAMRAGEVDFIMGSDTLDANSYLELSQVEGITGVISDFDFVTEFIALNDEVAPLDDLNVRTAIQMAIDKESIAQNIYSGLRAKADSVMPADMPYCTATVPTPDYDMDGAIALLEDSGWVDSNGDGIREKDGTALSFTITYPSTGVYDNMVLFFQSSMAELGIEIKTNPIDLMAFMQQVFMEDNYEMTAYMSYWFPYDPYTFVANMYPSTDYTDPSGIYSTDPQVAKALAIMSDEDAKKLIGGLYNTDDPVVVQKIYTTALDSANESSVVIPLNYRNEYAVFNNEVIESYTFNSIPNHVDVAAIHLK